jgi:hypothetical protein
MSEDVLDTVNEAKKELEVKVDELLGGTISDFYTKDLF